MPIGIPWLYWTGWGLLALGVLIAERALLADWMQAQRKGRRRRCRRCWYDMSGISGLTCPECGRTARHEAMLFRSRRRWRWGLLGLFVIGLGSAGVTNGRIASANWVSFTPSFVLVRLLEDPSRFTKVWGSNPSGGSPMATNRSSPQLAIFEEIRRRYEAHRLSLDDRSVLARKQFAASPPFSIQSRARWPAGVPVRLTITGHFGGFGPRELRATPVFTGGQTIVAYDGGIQVFSPTYQQMRWETPVLYEPGQQCIGAPPMTGRCTIIFRTIISESGETVWEGDVAQSFDIGGTIDDILQPVNTPEAQNAVAAAVDSSLRFSADGSQILLNRPTGTPFNDLTMGLIVEFVHDEKVVAAGTFRWAQRDIRPRYGLNGEKDYSNELWTPLTGDVAALKAAHPNDRAWRVVVRGDGAIALEDQNSSAYWSGSVTVPLSTVKK